MAGTLVGRFICLFLVAKVATSFPFGPPAVESVCVDLKPAFYAPHFHQVGNGTYNLSVNASLGSNSEHFSYTAGAKYNGEYCGICHFN